MLFGIMILTRKGFKYASKIDQNSQKCKKAQMKETAPVEVGPVQFSFKPWFTAVMQALIAGIPTMLLVYLFHKTAPFQLTSFKSRLQSRTLDSPLRAKNGPKF